MKIRRPVYFLFISLIFLTGCKNIEQYPWKIIKSKEAVDIRRDITMSLEKHSLSSSGAAFRIFNNSTETVSMDVDFRIQLSVKGLWYDVDVNPPDWPNELLTIESNESLLFNFTWDWIYGSLPAGTYRFVKPYVISGQKYEVCCEFSI